MKLPNPSLRAIPLTVRASFPPLLMVNRSAPVPMPFESGLDACATCPPLAGAREAHGCQSCVGLTRKSMGLDSFLRRQRLTSLATGSVIGVML